MATLQKRSSFRCHGDQHVPECGTPTPYSIFISSSTSPSHLSHFLSLSLLISPRNFLSPSSTSLSSLRALPSSFSVSCSHWNSFPRKEKHYFNFTVLYSTFPRRVFPFCECSRSWPHFPCICPIILDIGVCDPFNPSQGDSEMGSGANYPQTIATQKWMGFSLLLVCLIFLVLFFRDGKLLAIIKRQVLSLFTGTCFSPSLCFLNIFSHDHYFFHEAIIMGRFIFMTTECVPGRRDNVTFWKFQSALEKLTFVLCETYLYVSPPLF